MTPQVEKLLSYDCKPDETPEKRLNRLLREHVPEAPDLCMIDLAERLGKWSLERLAGLKLPGRKKRPRHSGDPVIVVELEQRHYLIDGTRRVTHWRMSGDQGPHPVLVVHTRTMGRLATVRFEVVP